MKLYTLTPLLLAFATPIAIANSLPLPIDINDGITSVCVDEIPAGASDPSIYNLCRIHPKERLYGHVIHPMQEPVQKYQTPEEIAAECGHLGVMIVPEGEDASKYRKCRDHPLGRNGPGGL